MLTGEPRDAHLSLRISPSDEIPALSERTSAMRDLWVSLPREPMAGEIIESAALEQMPDVTPEEQAHVLCWMREYSSAQSEGHKVGAKTKGK